MLLKITGDWQCKTEDVVRILRGNLASEVKGQVHIICTREYIEGDFKTLVEVYGVSDFDHTLQASIAKAVEAMPNFFKRPKVLFLQSPITA